MKLFLQIKFSTFSGKTYYISFAFFVLENIVLNFKGYKPPFSVTLNPLLNIHENTFLKLWLITRVKPLTILPCALKSMENCMLR